MLAQTPIPNFAFTLYSPTVSHLNLDSHTANGSLNLLRFVELSPLPLFPVRVCGAIQSGAQARRVQLPRRLPSLLLHHRLGCIGRQGHVWYVSRRVIVQRGRIEVARFKRGQDERYVSECEIVQTGPVRGRLGAYP